MNFIKYYQVEGSKILSKMSKIQARRIGLYEEKELGGWGMVEKASKGHRLVMENRELIELTGVRKVQSFDPKEIVLETELGILSVKGDQLSIKLLNLEEGLVDLQGSVGALIYHRNPGNTSRRSFLNRVFR